MLSKWELIHAGAYYMFLSILCVSCVVVVFPGQTQREGGWINGSRAAVVEVENYGAVISNNYGAMMNLQ